jgi:uncharacterized protein affecting Mg2+/Co2+ transport
VGRVWGIGRARRSVKVKSGKGVGNRPNEEVGEGHFWVHQGRLETAEGNQVGQAGQVNLTGERRKINLSLCSHITFPT